MHKVLITALLIMLSSLPAAAMTGLTITRVIEADAFTPPVSSGASELECPVGVGIPGNGEKVQLHLTAQMGRRDEPGMSIILRLDEEVVYILHHKARTYSKLRYPPRAKNVKSPHPPGWGKEMEEYMSFSPEGPVEQTEVEIGDSRGLRRSVTIQSTVRGRRDVEAYLLPQPEFASIARDLEGLAETIRGSAGSLLEHVGLPDHLPVGVSVATHQPSYKVRFAERFEGLEPIDLDATFFRPSDGYRKVDHEPGCF